MIGPPNIIDDSSDESNKERKMEPNEEFKEPIMQFFTYAHLPDHLASISAAFANLADIVVESLPRNPERTVALRKLLEAKDAAVRARLAK